MKTIKTVEDLKNTKIQIEDKEDITVFQRLVFSLGVTWVNGLSDLKQHYDQMYIDKNLKMSGTTSDKEWFIGKRRSQIFLEDVMKLKPKIELKTKDWVLARSNKEHEWDLTQYAYYDENWPYKHRCTNGISYEHCIPYEGSEHLLGTTKDK